MIEEIGYDIDGLPLREVITYLQRKLKVGHSVAFKLQCEDNPYTGEKEAMIYLEGEEI